MTFSKAQQEFQIRYYLWAISEFEKEINESFPNFRLFKSGTVWETYQFMQNLNRKEQLTLAHGLLKRFHSDAVKTLGESCSADEASLRWRRDNFSPIPSTFEEQLVERKKAGEKIKFVSKRKLQKAMMKRFKDIFGDQCVNLNFDDIGDLSSSFDMKCCGWILSTHFWYGRRESLLQYSHTISSEHDVEHHGPNGIYGARLVMAYFISFTAWLGITSQTQWEYLMEEDVEPACDAAIKLCGHFFEVAPKLLKGLEFEKITQE
jgi:hypothetical protein